MERIIHWKIPHVGELIFESIDTPGLLKFLEVSQTWKELAGNVLIKRWKGKMYNIMLEACKSGKTKRVQLLLERCKSEEIGLNIKYNGNTPFLWACLHEHKDVVKLILYHSEHQSIDLNARDAIGRTAFMIACEFASSTDFVQLFLEYSDQRIDQNAIDRLGMTGFMVAFENGRKDIVKLLLNHRNSNIDLNARVGYERRTALMLACQQGHKDIVEILLEHSDRFDINAKDRYGRTALKYAEKRADAESRIRSERRRDYQEIVEMIKAKLNLREIWV